jgi:hypothetical protein
MTIHPTEGNAAAGVDEDGTPGAAANTTMAQ